MTDVGEMEEDWDFYATRIDGELASIFVDLGCSEFAPIEGLSSVSVLDLKMKLPRPDGLSSREEFDRLCEIGDALSESADRPLRFVGRSTSDGCRRYVFYSEDAASTEQLLESRMRAFPEYTFDLESRDDREWETYRERLYPSVRKLQLMKNNRLREELAKHGDRHEIARPVSHFVYFGAARERSEFAKRVEALGFSAVLETAEDSSFELIAKRTDAVTAEAIDEVILELLELARELGGKYDRWGTTAEAEAAAPSGGATLLRRLSGLFR